MGVFLIFSSCLNSSPWLDPQIMHGGWRRGRCAHQRRVRGEGARGHGHGLGGLGTLCAADVEVLRWHVGAVLAQAESKNDSLCLC